MTTLELHGEGLWSSTGTIRLPGGLVLPLRTVVARLPDGALWVHAPRAFTDEEADALDALGTVAHLVAPNALHHLAFADAVARWPEATTWGAAALATKRPDLAFDHLGFRDPPWAATVRPVPIEGARALGETCFVHEATGTLICTDLVFNLRGAANAVTAFATWLLGTRDRLTVSRVIDAYVDDKAAFARSCDAICRLPVTRLLPSHGEPAEVDPATLREAFARPLRALH